MMRVSDGEYIAAAYADIFDYPLTRTELSLWSVFVSSPIKRKHTLLKQNDFFVLPNRRHLARLRKKRFELTAAKWEFAYKRAKYFQWLPSVLLIGVTGGMAVNNADREDDIDFFFITSPQSLWITRFFIVLISDIFNFRRKPKQTSVKDKICLNMFIASDALTIPRDEQDLFAAHEVLQMKPIFFRDNTYANFLRANAWVKRFLPNAYSWYLSQSKKEPGTKSKPFFALSIFEEPARIFQLWYMRNRRTQEKITDSMVRFHPSDARVWVKQKLAIRLRNLDTPLDKIFFGR